MLSASAVTRWGSVIVDADQVVRDVQRPGSPVLAKMAERFGPQVIAEDGSLDRAAVAAVAPVAPPRRGAPAPRSLFDGHTALG